LDDFLSKPRNNVVSLSGEHGLTRLIIMLQRHRVDTIVDDKNVVAWTIQSKLRDKKGSVKSLGCMQDNPFYLALSPKLEWAKELIAKLDQELQKADNVRFLTTEILSKYQ
jgi:hypothetical protein